MKRFIAWLFVSISIFVVVLLLYFNSLSGKRGANNRLPIICNNPIGVLHISNFDTSLNEFSNTHIYKSILKGGFFNLIDLCKNLIKTNYADDNLDLKSSAFISLHMNEKKNCFEYVLFFSRKFDDSSLLKSVKNKTTAVDGKIYSITLNAANATTIHCVNTGDYIVMSQSRDLIVQYLKEYKSSKNNFIKEEIDMLNCCFIISSKKLKTYIDSISIVDSLPEDFSLVFDALADQIFIVIKFTDRCLALDLFIKNKNFDSITNISDHKKSSLQQYYTANALSLKSFNVSDFESFIEYMGKKNYLKSEDDRLLVSTIVSLFTSEVSCLTLESYDDNQQPDSIVIFSLNDAKFFTDLLFSRDLISVIKPCKNGCIVYALSDCVLNKYITENLFPNSKCKYIVVLDNCVVLSSRAQSLVSWYENYSTQKIWQAPKNFITHTSNISYVWNLEKRKCLFANNIKSDCQKDIEELFLNVQAVTLQMLVQKDGTCSMSSLVVW